MGARALSLADLTDVRSIINDDETLMLHVQPALRSHNLAQLHVVEHPATDSAPAHSVSFPISGSIAVAHLQSLLSEAAIIPGAEDQERYADPESKQSFAFDHVQLVCSRYTTTSVTDV
jgi:capping protein alpha